MTVPGPAPRPWRLAMTRALYGAVGFYRRAEGPAGHFRTSVHASPLFAAAVLALAHDVDAALGHPDPYDVVDVGAGRGELLLALAAAGVPARWRLTGVEVADRPAGLPAAIGWAGAVPALTGLLLANEWLDNIPVDVAEATPDGPRLVLVEADGTEHLGPPVAGPDLDWLERWWPFGGPGARAEIGAPRDAAWAAAVGRVHLGVAVCVDYGHLRHGRPPAGSLSAYRAGRQVRPVPNGSCDITAAVAVDACAAAVPGVATLLTTQREAVSALVGMARPRLELARTEPLAYLRELQLAGEFAELTDRGGLGAFWWLVQAVGCPLPTRLNSNRSGVHH